MTIQFRDESGTVLRSITEGCDELTRQLPAFADPDFPYLGLVDPYGDTWFSSYQMRAVLPEIRRLRETTPDPCSALLELEQLAEECSAGVHVFVVFVGD